MTYRPLLATVTGYIEDNLHRPDLTITLAVNARFVTMRVFDGG